MLVWVVWRRWSLFRPRWSRTMVANKTAIRIRDRNVHQWRNGMHHRSRCRSAVCFRFGVTTDGLHGRKGFTTGFLYNEEQITTGYTIVGAMGSSGGGQVRELSVVCLHNKAIVARCILVTRLHCGTPQPRLSAICIVSSVGTSLWM